MLDRCGLRAHHPFGRLERLLAGVEPDLTGLAQEVNGGQPVLLSVGEPRLAPPAFVGAELAAAAEGWGRYPPAKGLPAYRQACADWMVRRYGLPAEATAPGGPLDPETAILPLPGSREALFFAVLAVVPQPDGKGPPPVVLIPNPFYHVYAGAAAAAGCEPVFVPATPETGNLPDFAALPEETLARTAFCFLCTPSNPQGAAADLDYLKALIGLAREHDFVLALDECYTEIYTGAAPPGGAAAAIALEGPTPDALKNVLLVHSLSKRSSVPGLRLGFVAGDKALMDRFGALLLSGGAGVPGPVQAVGAKLWADEAHVETTRAYYRRNFEIAERLLGNPFGYRMPAGGFFLWLDVGDGEKAAVELWRQAGIRVLPGAYASAGGGHWGVTDQDNPGQRFIRVALVYDAALTEAALARIGEIL